jgi:hypothetical protein
MFLCLQLSYQKINQRQLLNNAIWNDINILLAKGSLAIFLTIALYILGTEFQCQADYIISCKLLLVPSQTDITDSR